MITFILATSMTFALAEQCPLAEVNIQTQILQNFYHNSKQLFKVWHFVNHKEYDYNTELGLQKYRTFKSNFAKMQEHNKSNSSYKHALNHLSDMTDEEVRSYYNLKPMSIDEVRRSLRQLNKFNLDDYVDEEMNTPSLKMEPFDYRNDMRPVRNQGACGSCWAFATNSVLEGRWNMDRPATEQLKDWVSTQQNVDCDTNNGGCNGGWYSGAFNYFMNNKAMLEADYPYKGARGTCQYASGKGQFSISGQSQFYASRHDATVFNKIITSGPAGVAVDANSEWFRYGGGVFDNDCSGSINHAVTLVGYATGSKCSKEANWIIRNSWGTGWGEKGHIRIKVDAENHGSCNIERFAFASSGFKN